MKDKVKNKYLRIILKRVKEEQVNRMMTEMKKIKNLGLDRIGQDLLLMGADIIARPLTRVIYNSIENGTFPTEWKKAVVAPLLKKET